MKLSVMIINGNKIPDSVKDSITQLGTIYPTMMLHYFNVPKLNYTIPFPQAKFEGKRIDGQEVEYTAQGEENILSMLDQLREREFKRTINRL